MKDILTAIGVYCFFKGVSNMMTRPLKEIPADWALVRIALSVATCFAIGMAAFAFCSYCFNIAVTHWPF